MPQRGFNDAAVLTFAEYVDQRWEGQWVEVAAEVPEQQFVNLFAANAGQATDSAYADLGIGIIKGVDQGIYAGRLPEAAKCLCRFSADIRSSIEQLADKEPPQRVHAWIRR